MKTKDKLYFVFNFFMKMKNERRGASKIQIKNLLNMKVVVNYFNFVFLIEVKTKSKYKVEFCFSTNQKHEMVPWVHRLSCVEKTCRKGF